MAATCPLLHHARSFSDARAVLESEHFTAACPEQESYALEQAMLDGDQHGALHRTWSHWFSSPRVEAHRTSLIEPTIANAWRALQGRGRVDLITEFAAKVVPTVIFGMIGLPPAVSIAAYDTNILTIGIFREDHDANPEEARAAHGGLVEMLLAHEHLLPTRHAFPPDLSQSDFLGALAVILQLATQTTVCAVANVFHFVAEYPETWSAILDNHLSPRHFVDEVLRVEPPSGATFRFAKVATPLPSGVELPQHAAVVVEFHEANRRQPGLHEPERWRPGADRGVGASFGFGRHACAGRHLALVLLVDIVKRLKCSAFSPAWIRERGPIHGRIFRRPSHITAVLEGRDSVS